MKELRFCTSCATYTLKEKCCTVNTSSVKPPKYSPDDKYGKYRRTVLKKELKNKGLLEDT